MMALAHGPELETEGIEPSEVMYTSLITSASKLAKQANAERGEIVLTDFGDRTGVSLSDNVNETQDRMKALDVYTELILSLSNQDAAGNVNPKMNQYQGKADVSDELLMKVFLVLQPALRAKDLTFPLRSRPSGLICLSDKYRVCGRARTLNVARSRKSIGMKREKSVDCSSPQL